MQYDGSSKKAIVERPIGTERPYIVIFTLFIGMAEAQDFIMN